MSIVGIIANPASGKDIRRLVAHGSVFDNQEKVRIVRRVLLGLEAVGVEEVCYMPDYFGIVERACSRLNMTARVYPANFKPMGNQQDTVQAAAIMEKRGATCILTVGGDGTNRAAAKGSVNVPIVPISTGTNNVFPSMIEGTIAGLAAGIVARKLVPLSECSYRCKKLAVILDGEETDLALVDAVVYDDRFVASRAVWDMEKVKQLFLTRARPDSIGLSSIGGLLEPITPDEPRGLYLELGAGGRPVTAPVAPGMIKKVFVTTQKVMHMGDEMEIRFVPCVLALDGERELEVSPGRRAVIRLTNEGPIVVDVHKAMTAAMKRNVLTS
ncbi:MAG: NAD(+)/NADH kinase [Deltaproteobacteria bacterium]|nr:NAD(+)/NADH kinase [Deltaproteobacteria bacterium]